MSSVGVTLSGVSLSLGGREVLSDIDLSLTEHRIGLIGRNGSGKSSLLRLAGGLDHPSTGTVSVAGFDTREKSDGVRGAVGYLFQNPEAQLVLPTVAEDVALGLGRGRRTPEQKQQVAQMLAQLRVEHLAPRFTHQISGGEQQLVALAGALVREPQILLLDEPTTHLDLHYSGRMRQVISGLGQQVIVASHDLELIEVCERVLVIEQGRVVLDGSPPAAIDRYRELASWS